MATVAAQLDALGTRYRRFAAIDGRDPVVAAAWRSYAAQPMLKPPAVGAVASYREFYLADRSPAARVAFFEQTKGTKAIATAGAWGLLASMTGVIEMALAEGWPSLLILEDDVLFHRDTLARLVALRNIGPANWAVMQLGALQRHWEEGWITWQRADLYRCNGTSFGAHAVGLRREVLPDLLARAHRRDLPFDIGALQEVKRNYRERCFTCYPNLAIQDPSDSEIGMSQLSAAETMKAGNVYRWHYPDYGIAVIKGTGGRAMAGAARSRLAAMGRALSAAVRPAPPAPADARSAKGRLGSATPALQHRAARPVGEWRQVTRHRAGTADRRRAGPVRRCCGPAHPPNARRQGDAGGRHRPRGLYRLARRPAAVRVPAGRESKDRCIRRPAMGPLSTASAGDTSAQIPAPADRGLRPRGAGTPGGVARVSPFEADFPGPDLGNDRSNPRD